VDAATPPDVAAAEDEDAPAAASADDETRSRMVLMACSDIKRGRG
jgi:hypothetical protein